MGEKEVWDDFDEFLERLVDDIPRPESGWARGWAKKTKPLVAAGLAVIVVSGFVVAAVLFTQFFPAVTPPTGFLTPNCGTSSGSPMTYLVLGTTSGGSVLFGCGTSAATPAFAASSGTVTYNSFDAPTPYLTVYIYTGADPTVQGCVAAGTARALLLEAGGSITFGGTGLQTGNYKYCADYTTGGTPPFGTFNITWNQA